MTLAEFFNSKSRDPLDLKNKLVELHEKQVSGETIVGAAPHFIPKKSDAKSLKDVEGLDMTNFSEEDTKKLEILFEAMQEAGLSYSNQSAPAKEIMTALSGSSSSAAAGRQSPCELNSILVYNIAAMSYQTQQYGSALLYIKLILENMDQAEEFIQVKSLFLCLQILFELKMGHTSKPIMDLLDVKCKEIEKQLEKKSLIVNK